MALAFSAPISLPLRATLPHPTHPVACAAQPATLREAYKSAKAAYKSAKRAVIPVSPSQLSQLEHTYRAAKAQYKAFKRSETGEEPLLPDVPPKRSFASRYPPTPVYDQPPQQQLTSTPGSSSSNDVSQILVCGGKSCTRLGADAVAAMMKSSPPVEKCMKRCGGVGPTISVDGVPRKVNFRKALADAMRVAAEQYQNN